MQKSSFYKELSIVALTIILFTVLNQIHIIIQLLQNRADETFIGITHFYADFFLYVSQMAQGARGSFIWAAHMYTNEPLLPTFIYWLNIASGHIGKIVGLAPYTTYNVLLAILVAILLSLWYIVSITIFPKDRLKRIICFFLIVTSSSFVDLTLFLQTGKTELIGKLWFSPAPAFNRLGTVPHQVFQTISIIVFIFILSKYYERIKTSPNTIKLFILLALATANATLANPMQMLVLIVATAVITLWLLVVQKGIRLQTLMPFAIVALVALVFAYITNEQTKIPVFAAAKQWELKQWIDRNPWHFLLTIGPSLFFIPFGLLPFLKRKNIFTVTLLTYGFFSILFFFSPIPTMLFTTPIRYLHPVPHAAILIVGAFGMFETARLLQMAVFKIFNKNVISTQTLIILLFIFYTIFTIPSLFTQIMKKTDPAQDPSLLQETIYNHVPKDVKEILDFLASQPVYTGQQVVLTDPMFPIEILVPVFTDKYSFTGHPLHTLYPDAKEELRRNFFNGLMRIEAIPTFLRDHRIGFIIASKSNTQVNIPPLLAQKIYEHSQVVIYKVN